MLGKSILLAAFLGSAPALAAEAPAFPWAATPSPGAAYARAAAISALGQKLFLDPALSAPGQMSCATCHDPAHAFASPNALSVQLGGPGLDQAGTRAVPSLMYGGFAPPFSEHFYESPDEGNEGVDQGPTGGRDWDGRIDRGRAQAALPLLDKNEMANPSQLAVVASVAASAYARDLRALYGTDLFADPSKAFAAVTEALEFFQQTPDLFSPFSSKYDAFLRHQASLTQQEMRGLEVFNDPGKGNCAQCHKSAVTADGQLPLFTDFGYVALGLPRNQAIPANQDPAWYDLGLCGPQRRDLAGRPEFCGLFKAPTLRNVALRTSFYHNGAAHSLRDAVAFYAERDVDPAKWYPSSPDGTVNKFNDLPPQYQPNVTQEAPFGPERLLSNADVDDVVAFLRTLTDGYQPPARPAP